MNKTIWLLWLQGWNNHKEDKKEEDKKEEDKKEDNDKYSVPWLQRQVAESWEVNNPGWTVVYLSLANLKEYANDIDYMFNKTISYQAMSDIIRLSILKNHGGVWADSTMLCMQPLDNWVDAALVPSGFWMYHGHGAGMMMDCGPASWFIVSEANSLMISKWKMACDAFWLFRQRIDETEYFWMDSLFKLLYTTDAEFARQWDAVPYVYCETKGQAHTLQLHGMEGNDEELKEMFRTHPPYALKFWNYWSHRCPDIHTPECQASNGYCAIQLSKHNRWTMAKQL